MVFGTQAQIADVMPENASEALVRLDVKTGQVVTEFSKTRDPPIIRAFLSFLGGLIFFGGISFMNIKYVESIGGKISQRDKEALESQQLYN